MAAFAAGASVPALPCGAPPAVAQLGLFGGRVETATRSVQRPVGSAGNHQWRIALAATGAAAASVGTMRQRGERGERGERGPRSDRGDRSERGPRGDRGDFSERGPRGDRGDRGDGSERGPRGDSGDFSERGPRGDGGDRSDFSERGDRSDFSDRGKGGGKGKGGPRRDRGDRGDRSESDRRNGNVNRGRNRPMRSWEWTPPAPPGMEDEWRPPPPRDPTKPDYNRLGQKGGRRPEDNHKGPLVHSIELLISRLQVDWDVAAGMARTLQKRTVQGEGEDPTGTKTKRWVRRLVRGLEKHPSLRDDLFKNGQDGGVLKVLSELEHRSSRHGEKVMAIEQHHRAVRQDEKGDLEAYSQASAYMGQAWWMRNLTDRFAKLIDEYFLLTPEQVSHGHPSWAFKKGGLLPKGWQKYKVKDRVLYWNPETKKMQTKAPPAPDMPLSWFLADGEAPPREPPVALLDIGSCTDPFSRFPYEVESFAMDLLPAEKALEEMGGRVAKGDFFEVPLMPAEAAGSESSSSSKGASDNKVAAEEGKSSYDQYILDPMLARIAGGPSPPTQPAQEEPENAGVAGASSSSSGSPSAASSASQPRRWVVNAENQLDGIVEGSFDVVVLSLVLSFVDSAERRIEMIRKARRCLRDDRGLLMIAEVGSALADVSWYKGDATMEWTKSIEAAGFHIVNFEDRVLEHRPYREQKVYQWVFETQPIPEDGGASAKPLLTPKEMPWTR